MVGPTPLVALCAFRRFLFAIQRENEAGANIFGSEVRKIGQNRCFSHTRRKVIQDIAYPEAESTNARLAAHLIWLNRDDFAVRHGTALL
jgi:hypothetical protein